MKSPLKTLILAAVVSAGGLALPALAHDALQQEVRQSVPLKDGATLHVFRDGKMAKEDRYGRAVHLNSGEAVETADGRTLSTVGNEVARLDSLLRQGHL